MSLFPFAGLELSRRLEAAEAMTSLAFIRARQTIDAARGADSLECAGARAFFDGVQSPLTQTFCLGIFQTPTDDDLLQIERFFGEHGAVAAHEVSPLADVPTLDLLVARGYRPIEQTSVLYQPIVARDTVESRVQVRLARRDEADLWSATAAAGWGEAEELKDFMRDVGRVSAVAEGTALFFGEIEGRPIATASLSIHGGVAHFGGASTIPAARKQGAQRALLDARLRYAAEHGCDLAMMGAEPGSASQRNAEREGFRIAYTRTKWAAGAK